jgi:hypothetical protein
MVFSQCCHTQGGRVGSLRECTRILGLEGYRVEQIAWEAEGSRARLRIWLERRDIRGHECSGCGRRTWRWYRGTMSGAHQNLERGVPYQVFRCRPIHSRGDRAICWCGLVHGGSRRGHRWNICADAVPNRIDDSGRERRGSVRLQGLLHVMPKGNTQ